MVWKRRFGILAIVLLILAFLALLAGGGLYFYLPDYVQNNIVPQFAKRFGVKDLSLKVRKVGLTGADMGSLTLGSDPGAPALAVDSVWIDYSPLPLIGRGRINKVILSGLEINSGYKDGRFYFQGFDLDAFLKNINSLSSPKSKSSGASESASFSIGSVDVKNAEFVFLTDGKTYRIPFGMRIIPGKNMNVFSVNLTAYPRGQKINVDGTIDIATEKCDLKFNSNSIALATFGDLFRKLKGAVLEGDASLSGSAKMNLKPFEISDFELDLKNRNALLSCEGFEFGNPLSNEGLRVPWSVSLKGGGKNWRLSLSSVALTKPFPLKLDSLDSTFFFDGKSCKLKGVCEVSAVPASDKDGQLVFKERLAGKFDFKGDFEFASGKWKIFIADKKKEPQLVSFKFGDADFEFQKTPLNLHGEGELLKSGKINAEAGARNFKLSKKDAHLSSSVSKLKVDLKFFGDSKGHLMASSNIWALLEGMELKGEKLSISVAGATLDAKTDFDNIENRKLTFNAVLKDSKFSLFSPKIEVNAPNLSATGMFSGNCREWERHSCEIIFQELYAMVDSKVKLSNMSGTIPFEWPCRKSSRKGALNVKAISYDKYELGSLDASFLQKGSDCVFEAQNASSLLPGFSVNFKGSAGWREDGAFSFAASAQSLPYKTQKPLELGLFHPSLGSATFDGSLSLGASLSFKDGSFKGSMNSRIENSRIEDELNGVVVEKLNAEFSIDDILKMKSPPKQKISFLRASFGNLYVNDGKIDFQLESPDSIFIEKSSFKWCGGHLYTHAMRVAPGKDDYEMTLFCDRLKLVSLLEQLGVGKASGNGAVNGRLPLTFKNGRLDFQDGFLYSSPGEGGSIKLIAGDSLMSSVAQGLSENDPRMTQLELVKEALKDFEYEWAKLSLNTVKEDLKMHMVFDGKPSKPLPFRYSKETGGWLKVEANAEGSLFQGIKLDVNYKVPLAKLMGYGRGMKEIINKIK